VGSSAVYVVSVPDTLPGASPINQLASSGYDQAGNAVTVYNQYVVRMPWVATTVTQGTLTGSGGGYQLIVTCTAKTPAIFGGIIVCDDNSQTYGITVYDNTAGSGKVIFESNNVSRLDSNPYAEGIQCLNGIYIVCGGSPTGAGLLLKWLQ
jgi:hypothetical protein